MVHEADGMKSKIQTRGFRATEGKKIKLKHWPTVVRPFYSSKEHYQELLHDETERLSRLQSLLYAHNRYALLVIFQAMDAAGKDGVIKHVFSGVNPQGCQVYSFKQPSAEELDHDFLWRTTLRLPERGRIGVFNRSYYEEVLVVRVHPEFLGNQNLPEELPKGDGLWKGRYRSIVDFEKHLVGNGTRILKFYLHLSKDEQRKRFLSRVEDREKNWKLNLGDLEERKRWKDYMGAYEDCVNATSTDEAPWFIVPADDKENARLIVSRVLVETLEGLPMEYPSMTKSQRGQLDQIRRQLKA